MQNVHTQLAEAVTQRMTAFIALFDNQRDAAKALGLSQTDVSLCKRGTLGATSSDKLVMILGRLGLSVAVSFVEAPDPDGSGAFAMAHAEKAEREAEAQRKASEDREKAARVASQYEEDLSAF